jgi:short subunit dehydrogenase-like uncharacterized protein
MPSRIVLFGATGYTGRLTAEALVARGARPTLTGRNAQRLTALADELDRGLEVQVADVSRPETVIGLVERGDVLVTTVGPFARWGRAAAEAAVAAGAHYLDSTGEPPFIREVFERFGPAAEKAGCGMLTAFGYDYVPGNLVGALALDQAGDAAVRIDTAYFFMGASGMSGGTRASAAGVIAAPSFAWRDSRIVTERGARRHRTFPVNGKERDAISVGASEHFALPRVAPRLREVNSYLGWFGSLSRPLQIATLPLQLPGTRQLLQALTARFVKGSTGGPNAAQRAKSRSHFVAIAYDAAGNELAEVHMDGPNGYTFTADILAWGAIQAAEGVLKGTGALGPVDGFGLTELRAGCEEAGLELTGAQTAKLGT